MTNLLPALAMSLLLWALIIYLSVSLLPYL
jgi:hypothetical protein